MHILYVAIGGALGSVLRFLISSWFQRNDYTAIWPLLLVNILGSFLAAFLFSLPNKYTSPLISFLLISGFCGGFTTFSAFSLESWQRIEQGQIFTAFLFVGASLLSGLLAAWAGFVLARQIHV